MASFLRVVYFSILASAFGRTYVKEPKHGIFGSRVFMQSKPVWVGDLDTSQKNQNFDGLSLRFANLYFYFLANYTSVGSTVRHVIL
jgi:hypothetical protein